MHIEIRGATKRFGKVVALDGVELTVPAGRRLALVGPNGSGKSTLIRALLGLVDCRGQVLLDGRSPYDERIEVASRLAYVPQVAPSMSASARELVRLVCLTRGLVWDDIAAVASRFHLNLQSVAAQPFRNLSGGTKQKLLLSLAFASRPSLLVMDEPTASLDETTRQVFLDFCRHQPAETTIIFCSHRLEEVVQLCTHVALMNEGKVVRNESVETYQRSPHPAVLASGDGALADTRGQIAQRTANEASPGGLVVGHG